MKYLRRQREEKVVLVIPVKDKGRLLIKLFFLLYIVFTGCNRDIVTTIVNDSGKADFDTTLYNITYLEGTRQRLLGNIGDAIKYLDRSLTVNPKSDAAAYQISQISMIRGDINNAKKYALLAVKIDTGNIWYLNNAASVYFQNKQVDSVIVFYEKIVDLYPEKEETRFNLGSLYIENGEYKKAETIFNSFRALYGDNSQVLLALINIYKEEGKEDEAYNLLMKLVEEEPDNTRLLGMLAEHYRSVGDNDKAFSTYENLFKIDGSSGLLQMSYIDFLVDLGDYKQVISNLNILLLNDNVSRDEKLQIFARILAEKELLKAVDDEIILSSMIFKSSYDDDPAVVLLIAEIYKETGRSDKEIDLLEKHIISYPDHYYVWERLLLELNEREQSDKLYRYSKDAATRFNRAPLPKLLYALSATEHEEFDIALAELDKVRILIDNQPDYMVQILSMEADIYYKMENYDSAFATFDNALIVQPGDPLLLNNYAYFLSEQNRDLKKATKMIEECLKIESNFTYLDTYAWILYKSKKYRGAGRVMDDVFENNEINNPDIIEHYGYIMRELNDCKKAVILWQAVLKIDNKREYLIKEIEHCIIK